MTAHTAENEEALARRAQQGDEGAFDRLVDLCTPRVFNLAYRMAGQREDAEDIAQEVFIRVYHALPQFKWESSFATWLYRIAVNICYDEIKRRRRRAASFTEVETADSNIIENLSQTESAEEMWSREEHGQHIQQAILKLPHDYRLVVILADIQGLSYQEIAAALRVNIGTVKSRLNRGRNLLRVFFSKERELFQVSDRLNS